MSPLASHDAEPHRPDPRAVESLAQFTSMWGRFVGERNGADTADRPGLAIRWADGAMPFWNMIFLTDLLPGPGALAARLLEAGDHMRSRSRAGFVCVFEDLLDDDARRDLPDAAAGGGLEFALPMQGTAGDFLPIPPPAPHWNSASSG